MIQHLNLMSSDPNVPQSIAQMRYDICKQCEHFIAITKMCNNCWCFMPLKTMLKHERCPIGKWKSHGGI